MTARRHWSTLVALLMIGGCAAGPDYERPELEVPENYIQSVEQGEAFANVPWWELFEDRLELLLETLEGRGAGARELPIPNVLTASIGQLSGPGRC